MTSLTLYYVVTTGKPSHSSMPNASTDPSDITFSVVAAITYFHQQLRALFPPSLSGFCRIFTLHEMSRVVRGVYQTLPELIRAIDTIPEVSSASKAFASEFGVPGVVLTPLRVFAVRLVKRMVYETTRVYGDRGDHVAFNDHVVFNEQFIELLVTSVNLHLTMLPRALTANDVRKFPLAYIECLTTPSLFATRGTSDTGECMY